MLSALATPALVEDRDSDSERVPSGWLYTIVPMEARAAEP